MFGFGQKLLVLVDVFMVTDGMQRLGDLSPSGALKGGEGLTG